ncbi:TerD family protein [Embleya sp. NBC_00896]|uniref:TerD family protein n=1 Tax=Embleya sp. NBC_00896 TaxID=2975961 RepID=UPI00386BAF4D|nr:TerD family protein [Embleya sp. NBC_00896]
MTVVLAQGDRVTIGKDGAGSIGRVRMGLGWDPIKHEGLRPGLQALTGVDLDASCLLFDADDRLVDTVWPRQLVSKDGAVTHTGDNTTGAGEGDDESIIVDLAALPLRVTALVFTVSAFSSDDFSRVSNAFCRLVDERDESELVRYELSATGAHNAQIMVKLARGGDGWVLTAVGQPADGNTFNDLLPAVQKYL